MNKHPFTAEVVTEVYHVLAHQHANAIAATDMALATATAEGRDPLAVAMGMSVPNESIV